jgi:type II secretory pathway predicted ATPase ExeA
MNLELFKLKELPFRLSPDPQFLYLSKAHARAKAYMESTVWFADGFVVITGEIGCGKTTLIETFLQELQNDVIVAQINQTQVSSLEFLQSVLVQFGFRPFKMKKAELLATLNEYLVEQYNAGRKLVLVIDEAQNLTQTVLEEVRLLSGIETPKEKVLRIILAGQPELNDKLDAPELEQLAQRIRLRFHLPALTSIEMRAYILHRLEVAGARDLCQRHFRTAVPLHRRRAAADQHAVRHRNAGGGEPEPRQRQPQRRDGCNRGTAMAGVRFTYRHATDPPARRYRQQPQRRRPGQSQQRGRGAAGARPARIRRSHRR